MKRINRYFSTGCITYTMMSVIMGILNIINNQPYMQSKIFVQMFIIIMIIQVVLLVMENIPVKSQYLHIAYEFTVIIVVTFAIGIPIKAITDVSIGAVAELIFIIAIAYSIAITSLYIDTKKDAEEINNKLSQRH